MHVRPVSVTMQFESPRLRSLQYSCLCALVLFANAGPLTPRDTDIPTCVLRAFALACQSACSDSNKVKSTNFHAMELLFVVQHLSQRLTTIPGSDWKSKYLLHFQLLPGGAWSAVMRSVGKLIAIRRRPHPSQGMAWMTVFHAAQLPCRCSAPALALSGRLTLQQLCEETVVPMITADLVRTPLHRIYLLTTAHRVQTSRASQFSHFSSEIKLSDKVQAN